MVSRRLRSLALLLAHPGEDSLETVVALSQSEPWLQSAVHELKGMPLELWQAEHTRLFINGYPGTLAPPFESAYRHGQLYGAAAGELSDLYRQAGLGPSEAPPDYLGTELEFAAWLLETKDPSALLSVLWEEHLALWLPRFCSDLARGARLKLYVSLAHELEQLASLFGEREGGELLGTAAS